MAGWQSGLAVTAGRLHWYASLHSTTSHMKWIEPPEGGLEEGRFATEAAAKPAAAHASRNEPECSWKATTSKGDGRHWGIERRVSLALASNSPDPPYWVALGREGGVGSLRRG